MYCTPINCSDLLHKKQTRSMRCPKSLKHPADGAPKFDSFASSWQSMAKTGMRNSKASHTLASATVQQPGCWCNEDQQHSCAQQTQGSSTS
jgi:hypothetical protein